MSKTIKSLSADAGKGDKPRPTNLKKYRENFELIDWRLAIRLPCYLCSRLTDEKGHCDVCKITTALDPNPFKASSIK